MLYCPSDASPTVDIATNAIAAINARIELAEKLKDKAEELHTLHRQTMRALKADYEAAVSTAKAVVARKLTSYECLQRRQRVHGLLNCAEASVTRQEKAAMLDSRRNTIAVEARLKSAYEQYTRG